MQNYLPVYSSIFHHLTCGRLVYNNATFLEQETYLKILCSGNTELVMVLKEWKALRNGTKN